MLGEKDARELLKTLKAPKEIIAHCEAVHETCMDLVDLLRERNPTLRVDKRLVSIGALLHDIGRTQTQDITHGIRGATIIRDLNIHNSEYLEKVAKICERHLGGGITKSEAQKLGLPPGNYVPKTIEEKIIAYCDNMVDDHNGVIVVHDPAWAALDFEKKHGKNSEATKMVRDLNKFFEKLLTK
jgi:uncharacterized protein